MQKGNIIAEKNTVNVGFEKQLWDAACVLCGNMDASKYKNVVFGLIFLKYISDHCESKHQELIAEGEGLEEDADEYTSYDPCCCSDGMFVQSANLLNLREGGKYRKIQ